MIHFSLAHWRVLAASLLPIVCSGIAKAGTFGKRAVDGGYDNGDPRAWLARQSDWRARANAAQANSFEALPFFIGAVVMALQLGGDPARVDMLAAVFVLLRMVYIGLYVGGHANWRSVVWTAALGVNIAILFTGHGRPLPCAAGIPWFPLGSYPLGKFPMRVRPGIASLGETQ